LSQWVIRHPAAGGVITNGRCVSPCGHGLQTCSPHRSKDFLDGKKVETIFRRIAALANVA
jgi:hypothetical protein